MRYWLNVGGGQTIVITLAERPEAGDILGPPLVPWSCTVRDVQPYPVDAGTHGVIDGLIRARR
jgi:hypothetical protein